MKSIFKIGVFLLLAFSVKQNFSQTSSIPYYDRLNFEGSFFVIAESDERSNFYAINLSLFDSDLEKKYFEALTYKENRLIRIDAANNSISWYRVKKSNSTSEIDDLFHTLQAKTKSDITAMSVEDKKAWLGSNSK
ncbi:MAG: hypothetical protein K0Q95_987 [Bacteroidota bacterium]|jgi:hypothetical protein|nr:hypothetical protein [Bacteroidota bacterium]